MHTRTVEGLNVKTDFSAGVVWITDLTHELIIDVKEEIRALGIHTQRIINIQIVNALLGSFLQDRQLIRRTLEHIPFLGTWRNGKGIVLVPRATEHYAIVEIAFCCGLC